MTVTEVEVADVICDEVGEALPRLGDIGFERR